LETPDDKPRSVANVLNDPVAKQFDLDFDSALLNRPMTLEGEMIAQIPFYHSTGSQVYFIIKLRKWDGTTETEIASVQSPTFDPSTGDDTGYQYASIPLAVPNTTIPKGSQIRVTVETWFYSDTIARVVAVFYDALDGESTDYSSTTDREAGTTKMIFNIPVAIKQ